MNEPDDEQISVIDASVSLSDIEFVSFDVETTGLSPVVAKLVELSGVKFRLGEPTVSTFSSLINPECSIPPEVTAVHGITDEMVCDAPTVLEVVPQFLEWIGSSSTVLVAHNAPFDVGFLHVAVSKLSLPMPDHFVVDTLPLARKLLLESPNHKLGTIVKFLKLESGGYHRALADSHHVRNIFNHIATPAFNLTTWEQLTGLRCVFPFAQGNDERGEWFDTSPEVVRRAQAIREAINEGQSITFMYQGVRASRRTISPLTVVQNRGNFYLTGNCHRILEERTFRLDRMYELEVLGRKLQPASSLSK